MKTLNRNALTVVLLCAAAVPQAAVSENTASTSASRGAQAGGTASNPAHGSSFRIAEGSLFHVVLTKNVDAKKNKTGDEVTTTTVEDLRSNGEVVIPKNSKVVGHVTQIQARSKEHSESEVAIAFDRLVINDGGEIPLSASIQAVAAPETAPAGENQQAGSMSGGMTSGGRGSSNGVAGRATDARNSEGLAGQNASGHAAGLSGASQGVFGLKGLSLSTQGEASQGSVISSDRHNVHLEHGTQFVLRVNPQQ